MNKGLSLLDYENAVATAIDQLHIMYAYNGGRVTERTVRILLKNMNRVSKYPVDLLEVILSMPAGTYSDQQRLMAVIQPIVDAIKEPIVP